MNMKNKIFWINADDNETELYYENPHKKTNGVLDNEFTSCITIDDVKKLVYYARNNCYGDPNKMEKILYDKLSQK